MTSNNAFKKRVRAYAAEHGLNYAEARTRLAADEAAGMSGPPEGTIVRVYSIQQSEGPDGRLPYPFHIDEHGLVGRQDFWNGEPWTLIGFEDPNADRRSIVLAREAWMADPNQAVGLWPVFQDHHRTWSTYPTPVTDVTVQAMAASVDPSQVYATISTPDGKRSLRIEIADALAAAPPRLIATLREQFWSYAADTESDDVDLLDVAFALGGPRAEKVATFLDQIEDDGDGYDVILDRAEADAFDKDASARDGYLGAVDVPEGLSPDEQRQVHHFLKHGDMKCSDCVEGMRISVKVLSARKKSRA